MIILRQKDFSLRDNKKLGQFWYTTKSTAKGAGLGALAGAGTGYLGSFGHKTPALIGAGLGAVIGGAAGYTSAPIYRTPEEKEKERVLVDSVPSWVEKTVENINKVIEEYSDKLSKQCPQMYDFYYLPHFNICMQYREDNIVEVVNTIGDHDNTPIIDTNIQVYYKDGKVYVGKEKFGKPIESTFKEVKSPSELSRELSKVFDSIEVLNTDKATENVFGGFLDEAGLTKKDIEKFLTTYYSSIRNIKNILK